MPPNAESSPGRLRRGPSRRQHAAARARCRVGPPGVAQRDRGESGREASQGCGPQHAAGLLAVHARFEPPATFERHCLEPGRIEIIGRDRQTVAGGRLHSARGGPAPPAQASVAPGGGGRARGVDSGTPLRAGRVFRTARLAPPTGSCLIDGDRRSCSARAGSGSDPFTIRQPFDGAWLNPGNEQVDEGSCPPASNGALPGHRRAAHPSAIVSPSYRRRRADVQS